jgi:hypothetical protein
VDSKYGNASGGWCSSEPIREYRVGLWKNIRSSWRKFCSHTRFEMGDGSKVRLWREHWYRDIALKEAFLVLFGIACIKDVFGATHEIFWRCHSVECELY